MGTPRRVFRNLNIGGGVGSGNLFNSGWEAATGTSVTAIGDGGLWPDWGGSEASVQTAVKFAGSNALRVQMAAGYGTNGPDFRIVKTVAAQTVLYARWYQFFSSNYYFRASDHKMMIFGIDESNQDVYTQLRGNANNTSFRLCVHVPVTGVDDGIGGTYGVWEAVSGVGSNLGRNQWHFFDVELRTGAGGGVRYWANGSEATMTATFGNDSTLSSLTHGIANGTPTLSMFKWDTTYNGYDDPAVQAATPFNTYVDAIAVGNQGRIGA